MDEDNFHCYDGGGATANCWVKARNSAKHTMVHRTVTPPSHPNKELSSPKCQLQCYLRNALIKESLLILEVKIGNA